MSATTCARVTGRQYRRIRKLRCSKFRRVPIMIITRRDLFGIAGGAALLRAQDRQQPIFRVKVDMVVLSYQVTDSKNHYINGLKPSDFRIYEDGILQRISTFAEGAKAPVQVADDGTTHPLLEAKKDALPGMDRPD